MASEAKRTPGTATMSCASELFTTIRDEFLIELAHFDNGNEASVSVVK